MELITLGAALLAGLLTFLNPCVLPVLPLVFGAAANEHRRGPLAMAVGLALSFTLIGLFVATIEHSLGLNANVFRVISAVLLVLFGLLLTVPPVQIAFQTAMAPIGNWAAQKSATHDAGGLTGQFGLGVLLGAVWSPCVGPTLGAASLLASQGEQLGRVFLTMLVFGIGAAVPLLLLGTVLRPHLARLRDRLGATAHLGKLVLGGGMIIAGLLVLTGLDKALEVVFLRLSPGWLVDLTTRF